MQPMRWSPSWWVHQLSWVGILSILLLVPSAWALDIPPLTGQVVDRAHILSPAKLSNLNSRLAAHEAKTSNQVAVLTVPSLEGHPLEEFSHQVATTWALGKKGTDNGVLFLIAINEKKLRIEVGYGLEGTLTDAKSSQIIRHEVVPRFRVGDFSGGIVAGTQAILDTIEGTYTNSTPSSNISTQLGLWEIFGLAVTLGTIIGLFLGAGRRLNGSIIGGIIAFFVGTPAALWVGGLAGVSALFLVSLFSQTGGPSSRDPFAQDSGLGWPGIRGGPIGGSGRFGGGFGGGFGGDGGGFGGGGASGEW